MWYRADIKSRARTAFQRNYWNAVAVAAIFYFLAGFQIENRWDDLWQSKSVQEIFNGIRFFVVHNFLELLVDLTIAIVIFLAAAVLNIFVKNVIEVGSNRFFMENRKEYASLGRLGYGFMNGRYMNVVWVQFLRHLFIALWTLLLIVPGIIKSYEYRMIPYILAENPYMNRERAFWLSRQMMMGQKMEVFLLDLSFLGWEFASILTCGIAGWFFVKPYKEATVAELYSVLRADALERGYVTNGELPGFEG